MSIHIETSASTQLRTSPPKFCGSPPPCQDSSSTAQVSMGLLGGLTHTAYLDPLRGGTTDYIKRNECGPPLFIC